MSGFQYLEPQIKKTIEKTNQPKERSWLGRFLIFALQMGVVAVVASAIIGVGTYFYLSHQLAGQINQVVNFRGSGLGGTPRFFDRNGNLLFEVTTVEKRESLAYHEIPPAIINATVAVEDDTFWFNLGFDPAALGAAVLSNAQSDGRPVGASTITQQLVRHIAFSYEERVGVDYQRKVREIFYAGILTQQRSKQEILTLYLNEIYYGNLAYGVGAAAQTYFGKPVADLTVAEAIFLTGIPQSPVDWNPYINFEDVKQRQEFIIDLMVEDGTLDPNHAELVRAEPIILTPRVLPNEQATQAQIEAAHFILYVQNELEAKYGDALIRNGWQVTTSLDLNIQSLAEQVARSHVANRADRHNVSNASVVVLKPSTGEILAMVGSLDYFNAEISGQVNMATTPRQPGSSFKPITFVAALQKGWNTGDVLWDIPIQLELGGGQFMQPVNYDGRYHGPVLFRDALANSYNIPPIQLLRDVGIPSVLSLGRQMGIESLRQDPDFYGLSLTLGGGEVPLLEMTHAYATLANGGAKPKLMGVLEIRDNAGNLILDQTRTPLPATQVIDPRIAYIMSDILSDNRARTPAMGANSVLKLPFPAAAKTGTTNDYRDNWTIGYTPGVVVGVWSGNADGSLMNDSSGLFGAAPIWNQVMQGIYGNRDLLRSLAITNRVSGRKELPPTYFDMPDGVEVREVCLPRGTGGTRCTASRPDLFIYGAPTHGIARLGYAPDVQSVPGAWSLGIASLPSDKAQAIWDAQPDLPDGSRPPRPTTCALNRGRTEAPRLLLPIPPYYPDEVQARLWAGRNGYAIAPAAGCPIGVD